MAKIQIVFFTLMGSLMFPPGTSAGQEDVNDRVKLQEQQQLLQGRVETLKREQDFLLFEKVLYASDSKYLVLHIAKRKGQLKYKNRVLKDFNLLAVSGKRRQVRQGAISVTKKIEGEGRHFALIFGSSLTLRAKRSPLGSVESRIPSIRLSRKDLVTLFHALEDGSKAYILL